MSALVEFSMSPIDKGESVSEYVSSNLEIIANSGLPYRLNPMGTVIEGEWDEVFDVIKKCYECMSKKSNRTSTVIKVDWRKGHDGRLESKIAKLESRLNRKLNT